ncbi:MAG: cytochrome b/b6 domain-containing protein [Acidobacteriota bacterium]
MANPAWPLHVAASEPAVKPRHALFVRITHWITTLCVLALLVTGIEIIISHPRFYWGDEGNPMTASLFDIPIPASRPWVNTGYPYVLPDQNGWSRNLHFEAAWIIVFTGLIYVLFSLLGRHLRDDLLPPASGPASYNTIQRIVYLGVIFVLCPAAIWTGLAMSPAIVSTFPFLVTLLGGHQSARTIHFFVSILLVLFVIVHIVMVCRAGFLARMRPMITNSPAPENEAP